MSTLSKTVQAAESIPLLGKFVHHWKFPLKRLLRYYLSPATRKEWDGRIQDVLSCPDNQYLPRTAQAGRMVHGHLLMHNGIKVLPDSYYGEPMRLLLEKNQGVHEPQEERVFMEVLRHMPQEATMLELGAYWSFYSLWFHREVKKPRCILVEPNPLSLDYGRRNFNLNGAHGTFLPGYVGAAPGQAEDGTPVVCVDELMARFQIPRLNILHADIQGAERSMLDGTRQSINARKIDYIFISTHSQELHEQCRCFLAEHEFTLLADADMANTYSFDGLLVARRTELPGLSPIPIAQKSAAASSETRGATGERTLQK